MRQYTYIKHQHNNIHEYTDKIKLKIQTAYKQKLKNKIYAVHIHIFRNYYRNKFNLFRTKE